jgi:multidrug transporter EmrE-like cation transporter
LGDLNLARARDAIWPWRTLVLLLLGIAALRMLTLALHTPTLGYANQYDMLRTSACVDLWPGSSAGESSDAALEKATTDAPQPIYQRRIFDRSNCYWSSDVALVTLAMRLQQVAFGAGDLDLRWIGGVKTILLLAAVVWVCALLWPHPRAAALNALIAAVVLADPFVMLYANTLYTEFGAVLGAYLAIAGAVSQGCAGTRWRSRQCAAALVLGLTLLGCARVPHAPLAAVLAAVAIYFLSRQRGRFPYKLAVALLLPIALGASIAVRNQHALAGVADANTSNTLFFTMLPAADDPREFAQTLGLPPRCGKLAFSSWYLPRGGNVAADCPEAKAFSRLRLAWALLTHPNTGLRVLANALAQSRGWRMGYVGEVSGAAMMRAPFWSLADIPPRLSYPAYLGISLFALSLAILIFIGKTLSATQRLLLALLCCAVILPLLISLLGDGYTELPRHAHLSCVALATLLLALLSQLNQIGLGRCVAGAITSTFFAFVLSRQPSAIAGWDHKLNAAAGANVEISGWVLDAYGTEKVYGIGPGQAEQVLTFGARPGVADVFQGYPNAHFAGVNGVLKMPAPYLEIRVRNVLGVETVVDRIWATYPTDTAVSVD